MLTAVPLQLEVDRYVRCHGDTSAVTFQSPTFSSEPLDFPRSWMLPAMKDHIRQSELGFFTAALLPLAGSLRAKGV